MLALRGILRHPDGLEKSHCVFGIVSSYNNSALFPIRTSGFFSDELHRLVDLFNIVNILLQCFRGVK